MDNPMISGAIIGGITAAVVVLIMAMIRKPRQCPKCEHELPKFHKPKNFKQAMLGGYTCQGCGAQLNAKGELRETES